MRQPTRRCEETLVSQERKAGNSGKAIRSACYTVPPKTFATDAADHAPFARKRAILHRKRSTHGKPGCSANGAARKLAAHSGQIDDVTVRFGDAATTTVVKLQNDVVSGRPAAFNRARVAAFRVRLSMARALRRSCCRLMSRAAASSPRLHPLGTPGSLAATKSRRNCAL